MGIRRLCDYIEVLKPRETSLLAFIGICAAFIGNGGNLSFKLLLIGLTILVASAGAIGLTNYLDRDIDAKMRRTRNRALPSKRIYPPEKVLPPVIGLIVVGLVLAFYLAVWITDNEGFAVSESTVYRILRREGLVKRQEMQIAAAKEYHTKTTRPHQMWATDASYFRVVSWGYYYLVTVMDDYSRFILAWKLQKDMSADSLIEVVQEAVDATGMTEVSIKDRTKLLSDNGAGYVSRAFRDYLHLVGIGHILAAPFHPQTNGKVEHYQQSLKREVNQLPYELPSQLERAIADFVDYYNYRRYHKALGDVTPAPTTQKGGTNTDS